MLRALGVFLLTAGLAWAQIPTGSIVGAVSDPTGLAVAGASVTATHKDTGRQRRTSTNDRGDFVFSSLEPGAYTLVVVMNGFKKKELQNVMLNADDTLPVGDIKLEVGGVSETVLVEAQGAQVMTRSSEKSDLISSSQIEDLVVRGRNIMDLVQLLPGVVDTAKSQDISTNPAIYVMGNRQTSNNVTIDGVPSNDMGNGYQMKMQVSQDSVAEVKVLTSNYQAEYGRMAGSNVIVVTKSGARQFHGLASYFLRNEDFNANNFFNNLNNLPRPRYRYNTATYGIGGPITIPRLFNRNRDKLFFYWSQEFWPTTSAVSGTVTVPTAAERTGDFSQSVTQANAAIPIHDPFNNNAPFPNNVIPQNRLDANGLALLKIFPLPNFTNRAISGGAYNYAFDAPLQTPLRTGAGKVDYLINASNTITGVIDMYRNQTTGSLGISDAGSLNWPLMVKTWSSPAISTTERWTHIFTPTVLNEAIFAFLSQPADDSYSNDQFQHISRSAVGFNAPQFAASANDFNVIPDATFGGVSQAANLWVEGRFPLYNRYYIFNWSDNVSVTRGSHTFKAGIYVEHYSRNQKKIVAANGSFDFQNNATNPFNTGYAYANAALGTFYSYSQSTSRDWMNLRDWDVEGFVQDNWKVTRRLTLDYGLRLYGITPIVEANNLISGFVPGQYNVAQGVKLIAPVMVSGQRMGVDPSSGQIYPAALIGAIAPGKGNPADGMVTASNPGSLPNSLVRGSGLQWAPRFGFAYDVFGDGKMAIRGGGGIFYNRFDETYFDNFVGQPPLAQTPVLTYGTLATLGSATGLLSPGNIYAPDLTGHILPRVMNFSLTVQRDIGFHTIVDVGYTASLARHLQWWVDQNAIPPGANFAPASTDPTTPGKPLSAAFLRSITGYNTIYQMSGGSSSNYNSLQVSAHRRFTRNLQFGAAWTWSKAMDYNDADADLVEPIVPSHYYYGLAGFDRTQVVMLNYIYDLPKSHLHNLAARRVLDDWQLSGITSFQVGAPSTIALSTTNGEDITGTSSLAPRVNINPNPAAYTPTTNARLVSNALNPNSLSLPAVGTYGDAGKTIFRGPGINNWDLALVKNIPIHERLRAMIRLEAYNAFNHAQFSTVNTAAQFNPANGQQTNSKLGTFTAARDPRQLQLGVRLQF